MFSQEFHNKAYFYLILAIGITMPFYYKLNGVFLFLIFLNWILEADFKRKFKVVFGFNFFILFFLFYIWYLFQLLFTTNLSEGWFAIEKKSSFLIIPIIILSKKDLFNSLSNKFFDCFSYSTVVATIICLFTALFYYLRDGLTIHFFYHEFANYVSQSAIYLSLLCLLALLNLSLRKYESVSLEGVINLISITILSISIVLLSSKSHILIEVILLPVLLYIRFNRSKVALFTVIFLLAIIAAVFVFTSNSIKDRFIDIKIGNLKQIESPKFSDSIYFDGLSFRILMLKFGKEIILENNCFLFGVSPGNSQEILNRKMLEYNLYSGSKDGNNKGYLNYNYHNQFAETFIATGFLGFLLLFVLTLSIITNAIYQRNFIMLISIIIFLIAFFTESVLERQVGVVTFCLFFTLLYRKIEST